MHNETIFVVQRMHWQYNDNWYDPLPHGETLKGFRRREAAEAWRQKMEEEWRADSDAWKNPFKYASLEHWEQLTSLTMSEFALLVADMGVDPPLAEWPWADWWDNLTNTEIRDVSTLLDRFRFFVIVEIPLSEVNHATEEPG